MRICAFVILATCLTGLEAHAASLPRVGIFFYSNECRERESDDAAGNFVKLTRTPNGDTVEYGWGGEGPMEVADATDVHIGAGKIRFTVPPTPGGMYENRATPFEGTISPTQLRLSGDSASSLLPRRPLNYKPKICAPLP